MRKELFELKDDVEYAENLECKEESYNFLVSQLSISFISIVGLLLLVFLLFRVLYNGTPNNEFPVISKVYKFDSSPGMSNINVEFTIKDLSAGSRKFKLIGVMRRNECNKLLQLNGHYMVQTSMNNKGDSSTEIHNPNPIFAFFLPFLYESQNIEFFSLRTNSSLQSISLNLVVDLNFSQLCSVRFFWYEEDPLLCRVIELKNLIPLFLTLYMMKLYIEKLRSKTITNIEIVFFSFCPVLLCCILMQNIGVFQTLVTELLVVFIRVFVLYQMWPKRMFYLVYAPIYFLFGVLFPFSLSEGLNHILILFLLYIHHFVFFAISIIAIIYSIKSKQFGKKGMILVIYVAILDFVICI